MQKFLIALCLSVLFTAAGSAFADSAQKLPEAHDKLETVGPLALRASSPDAELGTQGARVGWVKEGETVKVVSLKQVSTILGFEVWVEVEASSGAKGWVFDGVAVDVLSGRGLLKKQESVEAGNTLVADNR
jgi:hypothetical protein